ncbi:hypothetical protein [Streptomyces hiroshimensis]|uniref:Uncharacterized protein n=1 Tax=Streptomyces hiroshimensis TaxID=66424 RepID=A0ABQ2Y8D9_9ACTN|nr:hypothetical protein [Streptomyces hiroshimensis]GGX74885.1 hypothetical protein GCM10010324_20310 [Streptomyces hiroshimensis]
MRTQTKARASTVFTLAALATSLFLALPSQGATAAGIPAAAGVTQIQSAPGTWAVGVHVKELQVVTLGWDYGGNSVGKYDWVGLFSCDPEKCGIGNYVSGAWQWASYGTSFTFTRPLTESLVGMYWTGYVSYDYASGQYRLVSSHANVLA